MPATCLGGTSWSACLRWWSMALRSVSHGGTRGRRTAPARTGLSKCHRRRTPRLPGWPELAGSVGALGLFPPRRPTVSSVHADRLPS